MRSIMFRWAIALSVSVCVLAVPLAAAKKEPVAVVKTPLGEMVWRFFPDQAPGHVAYVTELIQKGFYDGTTFHRVIPHFVVQGGDPNSKNADRGDDGGGDGDRTLKAEFSQTVHYRPGTIGMARGDDPDSGSCQFFVTLENVPRLDGMYTIFGELVSGLDVARAISELPRDLNDNPLKPVPVTIRIEQRKVPEKALSRETPGESGETLTGPGRRPRAFDPKNILWKAPAAKMVAANPGDAATRLEVAIDEQGNVIDVRFPNVDTPDAQRIQESVRRWSFEPAVYDGKPQRVRLEIDADGTHIGPPTGGGAPVDLVEGITPPAPVVVVVLPSGTAAPRGTPRLRLLIDPSGSVADAALQASCGDATLDAAAVVAARKMLFRPATRPVPNETEPEQLAVYYDIEARFVEVETK